jgi:hypothetical protein
MVNKEYLKPETCLDDVVKSGKQIFCGRVPYEGLELCLYTNNVITNNKCIQVGSLRRASDSAALHAIGGAINVSSG